MPEFRITGADENGYFIWTSTRYPSYRVATRRDNLLYVEQEEQNLGWRVQGICGNFTAVCDLLDYLSLEEYTDMYENEFALMEG